MLLCFFFSFSLAGLFLQKENFCKFFFAKTSVKTDDGNRKIAKNQRQVFLKSFEYFFFANLPNSLLQSLIFAKFKISRIKVSESFYCKTASSHKLYYNVDNNNKYVNFKTKNCYMYSFSSCCYHVESTRKKIFRGMEEIVGKTIEKMCVE